MLRKPIRLSIATLVLAATTPAIAADISNTPPPVMVAPEMVSTTYDWSGLYLGAHAGYFFGKSNLGFQPPGAIPPLGVDTDGFAGGVQAGYNWQIDRFVVGGEADISWADLEGTRGIPGGRVSTRADWLSTVRGRAGIAFDRFMIYGTGGVAFTSLETSVAGPLGFFSDSNSLTGWTAGAGVEWALTDNLSVKGEYLYVDFSNEPYRLGGVPVPGDLDGSYVRIGLNYKLNLF